VLVAAYHSFGRAYRSLVQVTRGFWTARFLKMGPSVYKFNTPCAVTQKSEDFIKCSYITGCRSIRYVVITGSRRLQNIKFWLNPVAYADILFRKNISVRLKFVRHNKHRSDDKLIYLYIEHKKLTRLINYVFRITLLQEILLLHFIYRTENWPKHVVVNKTELKLFLK
jgi:hypothetical protein